MKSGELPGRTLSGDALKVSFGNDGGDKSVYINKEAHVSELAKRIANGRIYVLDDVLSPAVETIHCEWSDVATPAITLRGISCFSVCSA